ncbi:unnamed protein product [Tuber aestivum]|uniref:Uncharacterized protein n=1 Tax=Tuber aestivum TaxID=59557 RepID=A0A292Q674_9PEZI|nr:unnamed protein product [Tuber aestivum]
MFLNAKIDVGTIDERTLALAAEDGHVGIFKFPPDKGIDTYTRRALRQQGRAMWTLWKCRLMEEQMRALKVGVGIDQDSSRQQAAGGNPTKS